MLMGVKGYAGPLAGLVNGPGQQFLAGAGRPGDQDRCITDRVQLGFLQNSEHAVIAGQYRREGLGIVQLRDGLFLAEIEDVEQAFSLEGAVDGRYQVLLGYGLDQVIISALFQAIHGRACFVEGRDHDALRFVAALF